MSDETTRTDVAAQRERNLRDKIMPTGKLKMWHEERGFGFIRDDDGMPDIFMHITALLNSGIDPYELRVGDHLQYQRGEDRNGRTAAININWAD